MYHSSVLAMAYTCMIMIMMADACTYARFYFMII